MYGIVSNVQGHPTMENQPIHQPPRQGGCVLLYRVRCLFRFHRRPLSV